MINSGTPESSQVMNLKREIDPSIYGQTRVICGFTTDQTAGPAMIPCHRTVATKLLNSHSAWHFLTGLQSELLGCSQEMAGMVKNLKKLVDMVVVPAIKIWDQTGAVFVSNVDHDIE